MTPNELAQDKQKKQIIKHRQAQIFALMNLSQKDFEEFIKEIAEYLEKSDNDDPIKNELYPKIQARMLFTDDELNKINDAYHNKGINEKTIVSLLFKSLKEEFNDYTILKKGTEKHAAEKKPGYKTSTLETYNQAISSALQNYKTEPSTLKEFKEMRMAIGDVLKNTIPDLDAFLDQRLDQMELKRFLVESDRSSPLIAETARKEALVQNKVPNDYGKLPRNESALIKQTNYSGRTGFDDGGKNGTLLRAYNIGFSHDQVLNVLRSLNDKIDLPGKHVANGQRNPAKDIQFKYKNEVYCITAKPSEDGKKIDFLKYKQSDYEAWEKTPVPPRGSAEDFIKKYAKDLTGDDGDEALVTPLEYAHLPGETYSTVAEALDEMFHHLSVAADKTDVYRQNLKEYKSSSKSASWLTITSAPPATPASGASLNSVPPPKPPKPTR